MRIALVIACVALVNGQFHPQSKAAAADTARWLIHEATWGYLSTLQDGKPFAEVVSFSDGAKHSSTGRIFFYLMESGDPSDTPAALTVGEASFNGTCGFAGTEVDPEDPRCAKLTLTGKLRKSSGDDVALGKKALFARHPQMAHWPTSHGFAVCELTLGDIWMIDFCAAHGLDPLIV